MSAREPSFWPAVAVNGNDAERARRLLERAAGYVVYGADGERVGKFVKLVSRAEEDADALAIRCERIFLWRRRTVPVAAVARVDPEERR